MRFHFPITIIDEDFRAENVSGSEIRALASAIEAEGAQVAGITSFGDARSIARQHSRSGAFILSIDDEQFEDVASASKTLDNLREFVLEIRHRNSLIPIFLYGETRTSRHITNDVLKELHGFIHMFEDTPEFVARRIVHESKVYLSRLAPPFFRALIDYAADGSYSWHCPGHSGGVAFLKSPVGQMFYQFFGENLLRADVSNSVDELGQLLDHTGPVAQSERNAERIFGCDHLFFVTNGTSTSNKIVWHSIVAPGDIVVVDRNCHKSVLHAIIMTRAIPVFLQPTRNHYGIIGPIPREALEFERLQSAIRTNPFATNGGAWRPLANDDTSSLLIKKNSRQATYDWSAREARWSGDVKADRAGPVALRDGDLDAMLVNLAIPRDVSAGKALDYRMVDNGSARQLHYRVVGRETIQVGGKAQAATKVARASDGKEQIVWVVEGLPVPARILQRRDGKDEMDLKLRSIR